MSSVQTVKFQESVIAQELATRKSALEASETGGYLYKNIKTGATTVVKSGAGTLHSVCINTKGTVASVITIYDNTTDNGNTIGKIDSLNLSGTYTYDVAFSTGLTIVTTGVLAPDITVSYK